MLYFFSDTEKNQVGQKHFQVGFGILQMMNSLKVNIKLLLYLSISTCMHSVIGQFCGP